MNIFCLDESPKLSAQYHVATHAVKMILELGQLLSTAHRVLDGVESIGKSKSNRNVKRWAHPNQTMDSQLYSATHINHPSAVWCRTSKEAYTWLYSLLDELCKEYTFRYNKTHKLEYSGLLKILQSVPSNIGNVSFTLPTPAMDLKYIVPGDVVASYRNYYYHGKRHLLKWKNREIPNWIIDMAKSNNEILLISETKDKSGNITYSVDFS